MSGYIDLNYISKIQPRLQQFKKKRDYLFNFRCPVCGDSKKSKTKARAYLGSNASVHPSCPALTNSTLENLMIYQKTLKLT